MMHETAHASATPAGNAHHTLPYYTLSKLSRSRLVGVHPDLVRCVERAIQITEIDFMVVEGVRALDRQRQLVSQGASTTMNSRHLTGHAVDLCAYVDGELVWKQPEAGKVAAAMKQAANEFGVALEWGGDWKSFVDTPHFQLARAHYPATDLSWKHLPEPVPEPRETREAMKQSKKYTISGFFKWILAFLGIGGPVSTWSEARVGIDSVQDITNTVHQLWTSFGMVFFATVCIVAALVFGWLQRRQETDFKEGRYIPHEK